MTIGGKAIKLVKLSRRPQLARAMIRHRVAGAVEHLGALRYARARSLVDVGANKGQFSLAFRAIQPTGAILAFEPLPEAADQYTAVFADDREVTLIRAAISDQAGQATFHVTDRGDSSSLFSPGKGEFQAFGVSGLKSIRVAVKKLDLTLSTNVLEHPILMKIDVQGAELGVLAGCDQLSEIDMIYVELSFVELYDGQPLFNQVSRYLDDQGFDLIGVFNQVVTNAFGPTQADFLFRNRGISGLR